MALFSASDGTNHFIPLQGGVGQIRLFAFWSKRGGIFNFYRQKQVKTITQ